MDGISAALYDSISIRTATTLNGIADLERDGIHRVRINFAKEIFDNISGATFSFSDYSGLLFYKFAFLF